MKHAALGVMLVGSCLGSAASRADLSLIGFSTTGAFGVLMSSPEQVRIQGSTIRRDYIDRGRGYTQLFDLAKRQVTLIDHSARQIEVRDLKKLRADTEVSAPAERQDIDLAKTGQTRPLRHWNCVAYNLNASIPTLLGKEETVFHMKGQVWLASGTPEQAAVKDLVKLAQRDDFFVGIPAVASITPAQSQLLSGIVRRLIPMGLPCGGDLETSYEGSGPMANLARKMPNRLSITFQNFSDTPVDAGIFALPAGYTPRP